MQGRKVVSQRRELRQPLRNGLGCDSSEDENEDPSIVPRLMRWLNIIFFGDGLYKKCILTLLAVEIIGSLGVSIYISIYVCPNGACKFYTWVFVILECIVLIANVHFGYGFFQRRSFEKVLKYSLRHSELDARRIHFLLKVLSWGMAFMSLLCFTVPCILDSLALQASTSTELRGTKELKYTVFFLFSPGWYIARGHHLASTLYLCCLWLFENWIVYRIVRSLIKRNISPAAFSVRSEGKNSVGIRFVHLMDKMEHISSEWTINHGFQNAGKCYLQILASCARNSKHPDDAGRGNEDPSLLIRRGRLVLMLVWSFVITLLLYLCVFASAVATGFVTDYFFDHTGAELFRIAQWTEVNDEEKSEGLQEHRSDVEELKLINRRMGASVACNQDDNDDAHTVLSNVTTVKDVQQSAGKLLLEFQALYGRYGMSYAGINLTLGGSLAVGSVISFLALNAASVGFGSY